MCVFSDVWLFSVRIILQRTDMAVSVRPTLCRTMYVRSTRTMCHMTSFYLNKSPMGDIGAVSVL